MAIFGSCRSHSSLLVSLLAAAAVIGGGAGGPAAWAQADPAMASAQRLLHRALQTTRDAPLSNNAEAGLVIAALRSTNDKDLLPFFLKLRQSSSLDNQIFGMIACTILAKQAGGDPESKDFNYFDSKLLFSSKDSALIGSALASLIDAQALNTAQLRELVDKGSDASFRAMAAGELNRLQKLEDRAPLQELLKNDKEIVRYYAGMTMLSGPEAEQKAALAAMSDMTQAHDLKQAPVQALMLVRMQKENITAGVPWAVQVAGDEKCDEGLRYTAVATALMFKAPEGPKILAGMIQTQKDAIQQIKLGLIAIEFSSQLSAPMLQPLVESKSSLAKTIAQIAVKNVGGGNITPDMLALLKEGHPIVLDWALAYADRTDAERRLALRAALVNQATIVDGVRDRDYERAALAAQKILSEDGDAGRQLISSLLKSENRSVAEAAFAGIFRSTAKNQSDLIPPGVWDALTKSTSTESSANYAALILAREGRREALTWLPGMILGGTTQSAGFRALAGWYYAKLKGQDKAFLAAVLADEASQP